MATDGIDARLHSTFQLVQVLGLLDRLLDALHLLLHVGVEIAAVAHRFAVSADCALQVLVEFLQIAGELLQEVLDLRLFALHPIAHGGNEVGDSTEHLLHLFDLQRTGEARLDRLYPLVQFRRYHEALQQLQQHLLRRHAVGRL